MTSIAAYGWFSCCSLLKRWISIALTGSLTNYFVLITEVADVGRDISQSIRLEGGRFEESSGVGPMIFPKLGKHPWGTWVFLLWLCHSYLEPFGCGTE